MSNAVVWLLIGYFVVAFVSAVVVCAMHYNDRHYDIDCALYVVASVFWVITLPCLIVWGIAHYSIIGLHRLMENRKKDKAKKGLNVGV